MLGAAGHDRSIEIGNEALDGASGAKSAFDPAAHHGELVAAETADEVVLPPAAYQAIPERPKHGVPGLMTEGRVHVTEPVHSEDDQGNRARGSPGRGERLLEPGDEFGAAAETGRGMEPDRGGPRPRPVLRRRLRHAVLIGVEGGSAPRPQAHELQWHGGARRQDGA